MHEPTRSIREVPRTSPGAAVARFSPAQRRAIGVLVVIVTLLLGLLFLTGGASSGDAAASGGGDVVAPATDGDDPDASDDAAEAALDAEDDSAGWTDGGENVEEPLPEDSGNDDPVELEPVESIDEQCGTVLASGASLLVTPDPAELSPGDMTDALTIHNCGDADVHWTAKTVPEVALDTDASTLAPQTSTQLGFTIDGDAYEPGAIHFKIKISEPGHNEYVDVHAFRKTVGKDMVASNSFAAGSGCEVQCITKARLTPVAAANSSDVGLEVKTNSPATIRVWVSTAPPNGFGMPMAASPAGSTQWETVLQPLQPDTTYHLLLRATDQHGTDERTTSFTTKAPAQAGGGYAAVDPGCFAQCISSAIVSPGADFSVRRLEVDSKAPAMFQAWVSTDEPTTDDDGDPTFDDPTFVKVSGLEFHDSWGVDLEPLAGSTTYHVIVRAEGAKGGVAHRVGSFTTAPEPTVDVLITFHELEVIHDGDSSWKNRGELSFAWAVGDTTIGRRGERKMSDGDRFAFNRSKSSYLATGLHADDFLPGARVSGSERDADGKVEFCSMGTGAATQPGRNEKCDAKWNVASTGLVKVSSVESMARCSIFGMPAPAGQDGCMLIETPDRGNDYARFAVLVSFHVAR